MRERHGRNHATTAAYVRRFPSAGFAHGLSGPRGWCERIFGCRQPRDSAAYDQCTSCRDAVATRLRRSRSMRLGPADSRQSEGAHSLGERCPERIRRAVAGRLQRSERGGDVRLPVLLLSVSRIVLPTVACRTSLPTTALSPRKDASESDGSYRSRSTIASLQPPVGAFATVGETAG